VYVSQSLAAGFLAFEAVSYDKVSVFRLSGDDSQVEASGKAPSFLDTKLGRVCLGVRQVWVHEQFRRKRIASRLLDSARRCFQYASTDFPTARIAFSQPTSEGRHFAAAYTASQQILVFDYAT
jgi:GNAT superfamily N-acetyltransferase